jgi:hypothetical protein
MSDWDLQSEPLGSTVQIEITISAEIHAQGIGEHFRAYAVIIASCGDQEPAQRMMLPGPYHGPKDGPQLEAFKARWLAQLDWIGRNFTAPAVAFADSLVIQAYQLDEGVNTKPIGRKLLYTKRQAKLFKELLPERERFWKDARKHGLDKHEGIWPHLIVALEERITIRRKAPKITRPKWRSGQIALVHAAMDAGIMLRDYKPLSMEQWRTVKREIVDRE